MIVQLKLTFCEGLKIDINEPKRQWNKLTVWMAQTNPTKNSNKSSFRIGSCCQNAWYKPSFYLFREMAACCYFGVDLGNWLDHNFPSRLTDGTLHRPSDLLYFSSFLPFTLLDNFFSKSFSSSLSPSDKVILSQNSLSTLLFLDKKVLSPTPSPQKNSWTISFSVSAANPFQFYKKTLSPFFLT